MSSIEQINVLLHIQDEYIYTKLFAPRVFIDTLSTLYMRGASLYVYFCGTNHIHVPKGGHGDAIKNFGVGGAADH